MKKTFKIIFGVWDKGSVMAVDALIVFAISSLCLAIPVSLLWNLTLPTLFGLPKLDLAQAFEIQLLASILFKGNPSNNS